MNKKETRFIKRQAFVIDFTSFTNVMQEIMDDSTLEIEEGWPALSMYSRGSDIAIDEFEITDRISKHLDADIIACFVHYDLETVYFVCGEGGILK